MYYTLDSEYVWNVSSPLSLLPSPVHTGIAHRSLRPLLGIVDPLHVKHMPKNVAAFSGFDVLWLVIGPVLVDLWLLTPSLSLYKVMRWSPTQLFHTLSGDHVPLILFSVLPIKAVIQFLISGPDTHSLSSKTTFRGMKLSLNDCLEISVPVWVCNPLSGLCMMLVTRRRGQPCILPVPMLVWALEMLEFTCRKLH